MRKLSKAVILIFIMVIAVTLNQGSAFAGTFEFDPGEGTSNSFNPRGYMLDTGTKRARWISSPFDNSGALPKYRGTLSGLDYVDVKKAGTLYALTDRNPTPGKQYLYGAKNGRQISNFTSYIGSPDRADIVTTGKSTGWKIPIDLNWEPGSRYEFAFLRGMRCNNGITLVFSEDGRGYIQNMNTAAERERYNQHQFEEYEFIVSYEKNKNPETSENQYFNFHMVPMRFTIQTYADLTVWEKAAGQASAFLDSVTERKLQEGQYKRGNVKALAALLESLNEKAERTVKKKLQPEAERMMAEMVQELAAMLEKAKSEKPEPSDLTRLRAKLKEARALYEKASINVGREIGQYGEIEVQNLGYEIEAAEEMDRFTPQNEVNDEVEALDSAITEVKASLHLAEDLYFYDKATGIYIIAPAGSLPETAKLFVRRLGSGTQAYRAMAENLSQRETEVTFYDIQFYQQEYKIQPKEPVEVQIPVNSEMSYQASTVYAVDSQGGLTEIASVQADGIRIFDSQSLGHIVLAGSAATGAEKAQRQNEHRQNVMKQKRDNQADHREQELQKIKKKKELFAEPLNAMMKSSRNTANFSNDVRKGTSPVYLIAVAAALALTAVVLALRKLWEQGLQKQKMKGKKKG